MCDECEEFPAQYVAYFNKAGGKLWRPAQKAATAWAIDIRPQEAASVAASVPASLSAPVAIRELRQFTCDDPFAPARAPVEEEII
jgi:hypothetical protein